MTVFPKTPNETLKCEPLVKVAEQLRKILAVTSKSDAAYASIAEALTNVWEAIDESNPRYMETIKAAIERNRTRREKKTAKVTTLPVTGRDRKAAGALV